METVHDLDAAIDSGETAETITAELSQSIVLFLVRRYAADRLRRRTRHVERTVSVDDITAVAGDTDRPRLVDVSKVTPTCGRSDIENLARQTFPGVDGHLVTWAEATIADHEARIASLWSHIVGVQATVSRHVAAVQAIKARGASCFGDLLVVA